MLLELQEEAGVPKDKPRRHKETMQTPHRGTRRRWTRSKVSKINSSAMPLSSPHWSVRAATIHWKWCTAHFTLSTDGSTFFARLWFQLFSPSPWKKKRKKPPWTSCRKKFGSHRQTLLELDVNLHAETRATLYRSDHYWLSGSLLIWLLIAT